MSKQEKLTKENLLKQVSKQEALFLVCGSSFLKGKFYQELSRLPVRLSIFNDFSPNPDIQSVRRGIEAFHQSGADTILAAGGGSAIDVAKSIKAYATEQADKSSLNQKIAENDIVLIAVPTTAGSGSEATHFAVIYQEGIKQSVAHASLLPTQVALLPELLESLPLYQRKTTMLDAFCHAIESFWSVKSTEKSRQYAKESIQETLQFYEGYLNNTPEGNQGMLLAAHKAGQAINLSQTTAAHAMSYKLTSLYGISHGHAVALCLSAIWPFMWRNRDNCTDTRGRLYLEDIFVQIAKAMGEPTPQGAIEKYTKILTTLQLSVPKGTEADISSLTEAVNVQRLKNNPVALTKENIQCLYEELLGGKNES